MMPKYLHIQNLIKNVRRYGPYAKPYNDIYTYHICPVKSHRYTEYLYPDQKRKKKVAHINFSERVNAEFVLSEIYIYPRQLLSERFLHLPAP